MKTNNLFSLQIILTVTTNREDRVVFEPKLTDAAKAE